MCCYLLKYILLIFATLSSAAPYTKTQRLGARAGSGSVTAAQILSIVPDSTSCASAEFPNECRTYEQVVDPINNSFETYDITSTGEIAALISLMAYESGNFLYQNNHWPGNPGQGSKNLDSPLCQIRGHKKLTRRKHGICKWPPSTSLTPPPFPPLHPSLTKLLAARQAPIHCPAPSLTTFDRSSHQMTIMILGQQLGFLQRTAARKFEADYRVVV
jgi:hypothetical protein